MVVLKQDGGMGGLKRAWGGAVRSLGWPRCASELWPGEAAFGCNRRPGSQFQP